jgi:hypothetical protein
MSTARYLYIWDNDIDIPFFKLFPIHSKPDTIIYSLFNRDGINSPSVSLLTGSSRATTRVFYSGEYVMDETHANIVIGFYPPDKMRAMCSNNVYVRMNVIDKSTELIATEETKTQPLGVKFIQLRLQELDYITELFAPKLSSQSLLTPEDIQKIQPYTDLNRQWLDTQHQEKTRFACFIVTNGACKMRNKFFEMLSKYKQVDSLGRFMCNAPVDFILPDRVRDRQEYLRVIGQYKFMITFENTSLPYYATEKIYNAFAAGTVPIYWGDLHITEQYNPAAFIHVPTHPTFGDQLSEFIRVIRRLDQLDTHPEEYAAIRTEIPCPDADRMDLGVQCAVQRISEL